MTTKYQLNYTIHYIDCDKIEIDYDTISIYQNGKCILEEEVSEFEYLEIDKVNGALID